MLNLHFIKQCGKCGVVKHSDEYHSRGKTHGSLQSYCRDCQLNAVARTRGRQKLTKLRAGEYDKPQTRKKKQNADA